MKSCLRALGKKCEAAQWQTKTSRMARTATMRRLQLFGMWHEGRPMIADSPSQNPRPVAAKTNR